MSIIKPGDSITGMTPIVLLKTLYNGQLSTWSEVTLCQTNVAVCLSYSYNKAFKKK